VAERHCRALFNVRHPIAWHEANAITTHVTLLNIIAPTVRISKAPPLKAYQPNARNTAMVAIAIPAESMAAPPPPHEKANAGKIVSKAGQEVEPENERYGVADGLARCAATE
jgi:hypothetical protein